MLPHIAEVLDPEHNFSKRCIKFINKAINSVNQTVNTISNMGKYGSYSILGSNYRHLKYKYNMEINNVVKQWHNKCDIECDIIQTSNQVIELAYMRDKGINSMLNRSECNAIIEFLCTN
jgi:hypothetical protein